MFISAHEHDPRASSLLVVVTARHDCGLAGGPAVVDQNKKHAGNDEADRTTSRPQSTNLVMSDRIVAVARKRFPNKFVVRSRLAVCEGAT